VPGVSGNPSGREKLTEPARHAIYEAKHYSSEAINKLVGLMRCAASEAVQYQAACAILDRAWGRPAQAILSATMEIEPPDNEQLKGADLERLGDVYALMIGVQNAAAKSQMSKLRDVTPSSNGSGMARRIADTKARLDALLEDEG